MRADIEALRELLKDGMPVFSTSQGKELFLVIGNTGAGKSTSISYLMSAHMTKRTGVRTNFVIDAVSSTGSELPKIGHKQLIAETLYSRSYNYQWENTILTFCDCPGFQKNGFRSPAENICESIAIELAIELATKINGVLIVIEYTDLVGASNRGNSFKELIEILTRLFGANISDAYNSFFFLVTKKPEEDSCERTKTDVIEEIKRSIEELRAQISRSLATVQYDDQRNAITQQERTLGFLELMQQQEDQIYVLDVLDKDKLTGLYHQLSHLPAIRKEFFDFKQHTPNRVQFNRVFYEIITKIIPKLQEYHECHKELSQLLSTREWSKQQEKLLKKSTDIEKRREAVNNELQKNYTRIKLYQDKQAKTTKAFKETKEKLEELNNDRLVVHWQDSVNEPRNPLFGRASWTVKPFTYEGEPFEQIEYNPPNKFEHQVIDREKGIYHGVYKSGWGEDGKASVVIYLKSKNKPGNLESIQQLKKDLTAKQNDQRDIQYEITVLEEQSNKLSRELETLNREAEMSEKEKTQLEQKYSKQSAKDSKEIKEIKKMISRIEQEIATVEKKKRDHEAELNPTYSFIEILAAIAKKLTFKSEIPTDDGSDATPPADLPTNTPPPIVSSFLSLFAKYQMTAHDMTKLHMAVVANDVTEVTRHSQRSEWLNRQDRSKRTPLHIAIQDQKLSCALILVLAGADASIKDHTEKTAFETLLLNPHKDGIADFSPEEQELLILMLCTDKHRTLFNIYKTKKTFSDARYGQAFYQTMERLQTTIEIKQKPFFSVISTIVDSISPERVTIVFDKKAHQNAFEKMLNFPELRSLLNILIFAVEGYHDLGEKTGEERGERLKIRIDTESENVDGLVLEERSTGDYGVYYNGENKIFLGGMRDEQPQKSWPLVFGTLAHELTHFIIHEVYGSCNPYKSDEPQNQDRFSTICTELYHRKDTLPRLIQMVFDTYEEKDWHSELIVRITQLIAQENDYKILNDQCPELLKYYQEVVLPACQQHLEKLRYKHHILNPDQTKEVKRAFAHNDNSPKHAAEERFSLPLDDDGERLPSAQSSISSTPNASPARLFGPGSRAGSHTSSLGSSHSSIMSSPRAFAPTASSEALQPPTSTSPQP